MTTQPSIRINAMEPPPRIRAKPGFTVREEII